MPPKKPAPQPMDPAQGQHIAKFVMVAGFLAAAAATVFHYPGFILAWIGVLAASFCSVPAPFTGPKAPGGTGELLPAGEWERELNRKHRSWLQLRGRLWFPAEAWPGRRVALAPFAAAAAAAVVWFLPAGGQDFSFHLSEGGVPIEIPQLEPQVAQLLAAVNAWCAFVLAVQVPAVAGNFASDFEPRPRVGVLDVVDAVKTSVGSRIALGAAAAIVGVGVFLAVQAGAGAELLAPWLPESVWQGLAASAAAAILAVCVVLHGRVTEPWRDRVEASALWREKWLAPELKLTSQPRLVDHQSLWDGRILVDTFEAPPAVGASGMLEPRKNSYGEILGRMFSGQAQVVVLDALDLDADGQPQPGTRSDVRFRVARRIGDEMPSPSDPAVPQGVMQVVFEMIAATQSAEVKSMPPLLAGFEPIVTPPAADAPESDADDPLMDTPAAEPAANYTMAWKATCYDLGGLGALDQIQSMLPYSFGGDSDGIEAYVDGADLYFGAVTADTTPLADPSLRERLEELATIALWKQRWGDTVVSAGIPQGAAPHDAIVSEARTLQLDVRPPDERAERRRGRGRPVELHSIPFRMMQGVNLNNYLKPVTEAALSTAVRGAPFLYCAGFPDYSPGAREGTRRKDAFSVIWSEAAVPTNPAKIPAELSDGRSSTQAAKLLFGGLIAHAFDAAKLARPEVIRPENLTGPRSRESIWRITVRLYDGVSVDDVRKKRSTLRARLGCEWLHVTSTLDADVAVLAMGASPDSSSVEFSGRYASKHRAWCEQVRWEAAFIDAKLVGVNGDAPQLVSTEPLETNEKVTRSVFSVPSGKTLQDFVNARDGLCASLGVGYVEARPGATPSTVEMLSALEDPMPMPAPVDWDAMLDTDKPMSIPFATSAEGSTVDFDLEFDPHLLVLGGTGTGKSITLSVFLEAYLLRGFDCYLADPVKAGADFQFAAPWMKAITGDLFETKEMLSWIVKEKDRRKALNAQYGVGSIADLPDDVRPKRIAVMLDEFTSLMLAEKPQKPFGDESPEELRQIELERAISQAKRAIGSMVGQVAREARSSGIHLLLATQKLAADTLRGIGGGNDLKTNLARLALGSMSYGELSSALKDPSSAQHLRVPGGVKGRGIFESNSPGPTQVVQSWYAADPERGLTHNEALIDALDRTVALVPDDEKLDLAGIVAEQEREVTVFGQKVDAPAFAEPEEEPVTDLGMLDIDLDLDFDDDDELAPEAAATVPGDPDPVVEDEGFAPVTAGAPPPASTESAGTSDSDAPVEVDDSVPVAPVVMLDARGVVATQMMPFEWSDAEPRQFADGSWWVSPAFLARLGRLGAELAWIGSPEQAAELAEAVGRDPGAAVTVPPGSEPAESAECAVIRAGAGDAALTAEQLEMLEMRFGRDHSAAPATQPPTADGERRAADAPLSFDAGPVAPVPPPDAGVPLQFAPDRTGHGPALPPLQF